MEKKMINKLKEAVGIKDDKGLIKLDTHVENILNERYYLKSENSWSLVAKRLSETILPEMEGFIESRTFIPSTPTIMNLNTKGERKGTLSSCFILDIKDSMDDIMDAMKECAFVTKAAGGVGYNWSKLRGSSENVRSISANSGGVMAFIGIFDSVLDGVRQGGRRRGAGMSMLSIYHPDILKFVDSKQKEGVYERSNFSVAPDNEFYEVLESDPFRTFQTRNVVDGKRNDLVDDNGAKYTYKMLWDRIIHNAWAFAEPGIFNSDISADRCTCKHITRDVFCNPCLTGDTLIYTADGRGGVPIKTLVDEAKDVDVFSMGFDGNIVVKKMMNPRLTQKKAKVFKVVFDSGMEIKATAEHELINTDGKRVEIKDLKIGESIKSVIRHEAKLDEIYPWMRKTSGQNYLFIENNGKIKAEHRYIAENSIQRKLAHNEVVHHSDATSGTGNPNSDGVSNEELIARVKKHSENTAFGLMCKDECLKIDGFPSLNTEDNKNKYRFSRFEDYCAAAGVRYIAGNQYASIKRQFDILNSGDYTFSLNSDLEIEVSKKCDRCQSEYIVGFENRHVTYCSHNCLAKDKFKPFMFNNGKLSEKYLSNRNVHRRLEKTLEVFNIYKTFEGDNFKKEIPLANSIIRPNNVFCPSIEFLQKTVSSVESVDDLIINAENNISGLTDKYAASEAVGESFNHKVLSIDFCGIEDVYDGTVENTHTILIGCRKFVNSWGNESMECLVSGQCSEYVHIPYTSCNLGSINISHFVKNGGLDWESLRQMTRMVTVYLNGIIDQNDYPIEKIRKETMNVRPIGLGMMGFAHALSLLGIPYDSQEGYDFGAKLSRFLTLVGMQRSVELAKEHGKSYPYYDFETYMDANKRFFTEDSFMDIDIIQLKKDIEKYGCYNSCITSIAPTGTISYIADCSSGIEPVFGLVFTRKIEKENKTYEHVYLVDPVFKKFVETKYQQDSDKIYKYVSGNSGSCQGCKQLTSEEQSMFKVSGDITPEWHTKILSAIANNVSLSVSKTLNLPKDCSEKEISDIFLKAHKLGIIGVTVYRDGCRRGILVHEDSASKIVKTTAPKRPKSLDGEIYTLKYKDKNLYVAIGLMDGNVYEVFAGFNVESHIEHGVGKIVKESSKKYVFDTGEEVYSLHNGGSDENVDVICRILSASLRHGCDLKFLIEQLNKSEGDFVSFTRVIARVLKKYIKDGEVSTESCPSCKEKLIFKEGCSSCISCGYSKCS